MWQPSGRVESGQQPVAYVQGHVQHLALVPGHGPPAILEQLSHDVRRDEAADDPDVGLEDGDGDVAVEADSVDDEANGALELLHISHHHQGVQGVDQGQGEAEKITDQMTSLSLDFEK